MSNDYNFDPMTGERIIKEPGEQEEQERAENASVEEQRVYVEEQSAHVEEQSADEQGEQARSAVNESATWVSQYEEQERSTGKKRTKKEKVKERKPWGFCRKAIAAAALAAVFGGAAGGTFYGVCYGTGILNQYEQVMQLQQEASKEKENTPIKQVEVSESQPVKITNLNTSGTAITTTDISAMVDEVVPAMVTIINTGKDTYDYWGRTYSPQSSGSGIIIGQNEEELLIVTNYHVAESAAKLEITFVDESKAEAKVKGMDSEMDIAVIAVDLNDLTKETKEAISIAKLGSSDELKLGEPAIVIGNALGIGISVTNGVISGLNREMTREDGVTGTFIQTDAAINHGNSGGALLNINGEVVGITCGKLSGSDVDNMGYAIPISAASPIIADMMENQTRRELVSEEEKGVLGLNLQTFDDTARSYYNMPEGVFVYGVYKGSGAEEAGIYRGDVITKLENEKVTSTSDIKEILQYYRQGDVVKVTIMRLEEGEYVEHEMEVRLVDSSIFDE